MTQTQSGTTFDVVLCATRFSATCEAAVEAAQGLARHYGARLILLHVAESRAQRIEAIDRLLAIAERAPDVPTDVDVVYGDPAHAVARMAAHEKADLVVIGSPRPDLALVPNGFGEVLERAAPCRVLTVASGETVAAALGHVQSTVVGAGRRCLVCADVADDSMCEGCRNRIVADALERRRRVDREGRAGH